MNISSYETGSALLAVGMTWWQGQSIIVILVGDFIASCFAVLNSVSGAQSHVGFPIVSRSVWGMWGAYFPILTRILPSIVWYGVQAVIGGKMVYVCLRAIWPSTSNIPNTFSAGEGITTAQFLGYVIFNVICCILIWFPPHKLRHYFHVGSVLVFVAQAALLGWALGQRGPGGFGPVFASQTDLKGSKLAWSMCNGIMSVIGSIASGILNQNDFTRFAKRTNQVTWTQGLSFNFTSAFIHITGVLVTASTQTKYGKGTPLWDLSELFVAMQDELGSRGRAATFFLAFTFIISQCSINVPGNVLAAGLDVASVFPKYVNLRRGAYVIAALSVLPIPWRQLASGSIFLSVLNAYAVFLGPMVGLLCVHYYIIQKRVFHIPDLYEGSSKSAYWYFYGVNWRSFVAWVAAVMPSMPGFVHSINGSGNIGTGATHIFDLSFLVGFCIAAAVAYLLHWIFPVYYPLENCSDLECAGQGSIVVDHGVSVEDNIGLGDGFVSGNEKVVSTEKTSTGIDSILKHA
ncbi:hypothetical protein BP6252_06060 [Coleophoma cylindrospora]|uniref:Uncharacterized protein n=1 Tax=Coleophoma cylindrospora TaxID=1849047 RepID=A0A3D8RLS6_9HELO|nr:hypothetical protein BP6252_06060 [Coleophoma cylindrospora]